MAKPPIYLVPSGTLKSKIAMDRSLEEAAKSINAHIPHRIDFGEHGFIQFQKGPVSEGTNGITLEVVLLALEEHLSNLIEVLYSNESVQALHHLVEARLWLQERTRLRKEQGVEGTYHPHRSIR